MRGHIDSQGVVPTEQNPKRIERGELVIGTISQGKYGGQQIIGRYKGQKPTGEHILADRRGSYVEVKNIRRAKLPAKTGQKNVQAPPQKRSPALEAEIEKLRQSPHIGRQQLRRILQITGGDITGLRVGYRPETNNIWIVYHRRRYDIDRNGGLSRQERLGGHNLSVANALARNLKCPLCGAKNNVPRYEVNIKCSECGFPLHRVRIQVR